MKNNIYFLIFLFNSILVFSTVRYVNYNSITGSSPYISWSTAGNDLQSVINISQAGDEIWVASGTYIPTRDPFGNTSPSDSRDKTFYLKDGISVYGGFNGTETSLASRNYNINVTILSGDLGILGTTTDNSYHVVLFSGSSTSAVGVRLDGFSITCGSAYGVVNNNINGNVVPRLEGPAVFFLYGNNIISNNKIYLNKGYSGGGIYTSNTNSIISNNEIYNNTATYDGGGIFASEGINNMILKNVIGKNRAGISQIDTYYYGGGGIYTQKGSNTIMNNVFYENTSDYMGGAIFLYYGNNKIINNTIYKNKATSGGGFYTYLGTNTVKNNIFWANINGTNNEPGADYKNHHDWPATNHIFNNILQLSQNQYNAANDNSLYGNASNNIFQTNPNFNNEANVFGADGILRTSDDGLSLISNSIAINAGHVTDAPADDIVGNVRVGSPDVGAYELTGNLGIAESKNSHIGIYPNPANKVLNINSNIRIDAVAIIDLSGRKIFEQRSNSRAINIQHIKKGIYLLRIYYEDKVATFKFIIE